MIEHVAKAICFSEFFGREDMLTADTYWREVSDSAKVVYRNMALGALEALRHPPEGGHNCLVFQVALDEALKEANSPPVETDT